MLEKSLWLSTFNDHLPALQCAFVALLREKERRQQSNQGIKKDDRKEPNITTDTIDAIIGAAFGFNPAYAGKLRRFCYNALQKENSLSSSGPEEIKLAKIEPFNASLMKELCEQAEIYFQDDIYDGILLLSNYALPLTAVLKEGGGYQIHPNIKKSVEAWMDNFCAIIDTNSDYPYWRTIFLYLHQFRVNELVWALLVMLPSIPEEKIQKWINSFDNIPSTKTIGEIESSQQDTAFLLQFRDDLLNLNKLSSRKAVEKDGIFKDVSILDLQCAYFHMDHFKYFAKNRLRPNDIYLIYLIITKLKPDYQEIILGDIEDNSQVRLKEPDVDYGYFRL